MLFNPLDDPASRQELITDYLDHLCGPLLGVVSRAERQAIRAEAEDHLYGLIADYEADGDCSPEEATAAALREYGEPWQVGQMFLESWCRFNARPKGALVRYLPPGISLPCFVTLGSGTAAYQIILQSNLLQPKPDPMGDIWLLVIALLAPMIAGYCVGRSAIIRPERPYLLAMAIVLLQTLATSVAMLPSREGFTLLALQILYWLPMGCACAVFTASMYQYHRRTSYLSRIRL